MELVLFVFLPDDYSVMSLLLDMAIDRYIINKLQSCTCQPMKHNLLRLFLIRVEKAWHEEEALKSAL
ncbi:hypothetical protein [Paenibacillus lentus]|uniref:Uncharacterized protein n=1 Tax=Paenibacillus lentus TaxID=1338368 RepID=A0A3Q8SCU7_9BACL|nr:hypothetical protein [Paenibacillus lentus]AZK47688.1 hypothetical protein EIM92_17290 [Paenibacillus lentus]